MINRMMGISWKSKSSRSDIKIFIYLDDTELIDCDEDEYTSVVIDGENHSEMAMPLMIEHNY